MASDSNVSKSPFQPTPEKSVAYFELAVSLYLWFWPALTTAVQNEWGGHDSAEKRDLLAGSLADLFTSSQREQDVEDIEYICAQAMSDGFNVMLEDNSAYEVATAICGAWRDCQEGQFTKIEGLKTRFLALQEQKEQREKTKIANDSDSSGTDAELDEEDDTGDAMDVDAGPSTATQNREPIIDDDGFELVQSKGKGSRRH